MGTIAARRTARLVELAAYVLAIQAIALAQAMEMTEGSTRAFSASSQELLARVRQTVLPLDRDRPLSPDIAALASLFLSTRWRPTLPQHDMPGEI